MSDIFKKITSIEPVDSDALDALNLGRKADKKPADTDAVSPQTPQKNDDISKPLNLTIPLDDDVPQDDSPTQNERVPDVLSKDTKIETPKPVETRDDAATMRIRPLGLTPVIPVVKSTNNDAPLTTAAAPKTSAPKMPDKSAANTKVAPAKIPDPIASDSRVSDPVPSFVTRNSAAALPAIDTEPRYGRIMWIGGLAALIWAVAATALAVSIFSAQGTLSTLSIWQVTAAALLVVIPALFILLGSYAIRQLAKLSVQSTQIASVANAMMQPDETVITRSTIMSKTIQAQIEEVNLKIAAALNRMEMLDDVVKSQGASLSKSTLAAENTATHIADTLTTQREALDTVADSFERRMGSLSTVLDAHSENLAASTQMAEQKIQEARLSIEDAATKINAASDVVRDNAITAADTLTGSHTEITLLGNAVKARSDEIDTLYRKHLTDLTAMIDHLSKEQEDMSTSLEERLEKMRDMTLSAKLGAQSLSEASEKGRETVEALADAARLTDTAVRARFAEMEDMVKYSTARAESISDTAARQVQNSLSATRKDIARIEADMMDMMSKLDKASAARAAQTNNAELAPPAVTTEPKSKRLTLRPLESDFPSIEPALTQDPVQDTLNDDRDIEADAVEPETLFRLDPAPETSDAQSIAPPPVADDPIDLPEDDSQQLTLEPLDLSDLEATTPAEPLVQFDPDMVRTSGEPTTKDAPKKKEKGFGFRWKGIFGGSQAPDTAISAITAPKPAAPNLPSVDDGDIVEALSKLGLSPSAVVDDGCIIEAANLRKVRGESAMSHAVKKRLKGPVDHLVSAAAQDPSLKTDMRAFTSQFAAKISGVETEREEIRTRLESDAGRAYLLCDAALNG